LRTVSTVLMLRWLFDRNHTTAPTATDVDPGERVTKRDQMRLERLERLFEPVEHAYDAAAKREQCQPRDRALLLRCVGGMTKRGGDVR
jgi:hypothetical protein